MADTGSDMRSRLKQWFDSAKDDFEREAPEVLEGMAADARKLAQFLDDKAKSVRRRQANEEALPETAVPPTNASAERDTPPTAE